MKSLELAKRNFKEVWRDWLSLLLTIGLPVAMFLILQALGGVDDFFSPTSLAPGVAVFGFVMLMFSSALSLARDRESALFARLLTAPLRPNDFMAGYSLPYLPVAIIQGLLIYAIGATLGLEINGSVALVFLVLLVIAIFFIGLGMILGALFTVKQVPILYTAILLLAIFGGTWIDLEAIGGVFQTVGNVFPFAHALEAARAIMIDGADLGAIATDLYWVLAYTLVVVVLAVVTFKRKMLE